MIYKLPATSRLRNSRAGVSAYIALYRPGFGEIELLQAFLCALGHPMLLIRNRKQFFLNGWKYYALAIPHPTHAHMIIHCHPVEPTPSTGARRRACCQWDVGHQVETARARNCRGQSAFPRKAGLQSLHLGVSSRHMIDLVGAHT